MAGVRNLMLFSVIGQLIFGCCNTVFSATKIHINSTDEIEKFELFNHQFRRNYDVNNQQEYYQRKINFESSIRRHVYLNSVSKHLTNHSAKYGVNQFSDLSPEQFRETYLTAQAKVVPKYTPLKHGNSLKRNLPTKFDWRDKGAVNPIQNQEACGGCWAFSIVGAVESVHVKNGGALKQLSVQQVIDCSYNNHGCNGGSTVTALDWLNKTKEKLVSQSEYPFKAKNGMCHYFAPSHDGISVKNYQAHNFSGQEKEMMARLIEWGPLAVIVDAVSWQDYLGGIIQHHCSSHNPNHAVLVIGYDTTGDVPYWIVRNSWGTSWGDEGYAYIKIGANMCGIADSVTAVFL
ncbi:cathepsin O [Chanos chanos]|uniref:Cathepsin O n=1 Tax=Chanos chanos TaxID=29144 RepID=A0A6J2VHB0_CHACN|nr:cathepsin O [Chanos chanos]